MIREIANKWLNKQPLTEEEQLRLLDYFARTESAAPTTNPLTGQTYISLGPNQNEINAMVEQAISSSAKQWFPRLSDITNQLGLQSAGEFRTGTGVPGDGFTGGRFGWPGFTYGADTYFLAGVENDVLQVGLSLTDGKIYAGAGSVVLDDSGIVATAGTIGGWTIGANTITAANGEAGMSSEVTGSTDFRFWSGDADPSLANFAVTEGGTLFASDAVIVGNITATAGLIGGWVIGPQDFHDATNRITLDSTNARINVGNQAGTYITIDGTNQYIKSSNFATGSAGFSIASDTGDAEFNNITARGELKTFLFSSSNQMAVAGNIVVSKNAGKLGADVTAIATTVNFGQAMTVGDWIKIQGPDSAGSNALEAMLIGSLVSGTTYNVTRNVDGSGANAWKKDTPFVVIGQSGDSRIELTAGASGSIQLITQGAAYGTTTTQASMSTVAGAITAGAGNVLINASGIVMANSASSWFNFKDAGGNANTINIAATPSNTLEITNIATSGGAGTIAFYIKDTAGVTRRPLQLLEDAGNANVLHALVNVGSAGSKFSIGSEVVIWAGKTGTTTVFNEAGLDIDFRVESDTNANFFLLDASAENLFIGGRVDFRDSSNVTQHIIAPTTVSFNEANADIDFVVHGDTQDGVFVVDAGLNRVEIGTTTEAVHVIDPTTTTYFNEPGNDLDFVVRGDTDTSLLYVDAGLDAIGIGGAASGSYKLQVTGSINATGSYYQAGTLTRHPVAETNANDIFQVTNPGGASLWTGTISGAPSGTSVTVSAPLTGTEAVLVPTSTSQLGKMRLYNTTRGTSALISNYNTGTNVVTLTATVPAAWANGDSLTVASQTVSGGGVNWVDIEITSGPTGKTSLFLNMVISSATVGDTQRVHPTETFGAGKIMAQVALVANQNSNRLALLPIASNLFSLSWTGTPTAVLVREAGYIN
jgi:hypothetical protein